MSWTITINELLVHRRGTSVFSTFTVRVDPHTSVDEFMQIIRNAPENPEPSISANNLTPFVTDKNAPRSFDWTPVPGRTIAAAGLTDGAVLAFPSRRVAD